MDFDALASLVAASIIYPGAIPVVPRFINSNVKAFLSIHKDLFKMYSPDEVDIDSIDSLVIVDVSRWDRLDRLDALKNKKGLEILIWDHHPGNSDINPTWQCREEMGANITLMIRKIKEERKLITPVQATLFLVGLYEDTGNLRFPSTKAEDALAAGFLLDRKADLNVLNSLLSTTYGEKQKEVLFEMENSSTREHINGYSVTFSRLYIEGHVEGLALVVNMYKKIVNVDAAFGIFSDRDHKKCIVIGRSSTDAFNVGMIMQSIGGGGHPGAGSAMLKNVEPKAVEEMIKELIRGNQQASVQISDLMSFPVSFVPPDTSMHEVAVILREKGCTGVPVVENEKIVGVISRRDFKKIKNESQLKAPVKAFMSTKIQTIDPGKSPMQAAKIMIKHDIGRLPVVEDGKVIGIITRSDAMTYFYDLLPD